MVLIRLFLILLVIYLVIRIFARFLLRSFVKNVNKNFENRQNEYRGKKEGDVTVNAKPKHNKKIDRDEGVYVDYEELDE